MLYQNYLRIIFSLVCLSLTLEMQCMFTMHQRLERAIRPPHPRSLSTNSIRCDDNFKVTLEMLSSIRPEFKEYSSTSKPKSGFKSVAYSEKKAFGNILKPIFDLDIKSINTPVDEKCSLIARSVVVCLFDSISCLVKARASVFSMDEKPAKNTTLFSLISEVRNALNIGPLNGISADSRQQYIEKLTEFIISMGLLSTNEKNELTAVGVGDERIDKFLKYLNFGPDNKGLYHENDTGLLKTRKKKRLYFQVSENIRLVLAYIFLEAHSGSEIVAGNNDKAGSISSRQVIQEMVQRTEMSSSEVCTKKIFNLGTNVISKVVEASYTETHTRMRKVSTETILRAFDVTPMCFQSVKALSILMSGLLICESKSIR